METIDRVPKLNFLCPREHFAEQFPEDAVVFKLHRELELSLLEFSQQLFEKFSKNNLRCFPCQMDLF